MTKFDEFTKLASQRDAIEQTQEFLSEQLAAINMNLDRMSVELTNEVADDLDGSGALVFEEEQAGGISYEEEQYPHLDQLQVA